MHLYVKLLCKIFYIKISEIGKCNVNEILLMNIAAFYHNADKFFK